MSEAGSLWVTFEVKSGAFMRDMELAEKKFEKTKEAAEKIGDAMKGVGLAASALGASIVGSMGLAVTAWANAGDEVGKMSKRTGIGTTAIQELSYAAKLSGTSIEEVEVAVRKMQSSITDASSGVDTAEKSFKALGIPLSEIKNLSPEEQFNRISTAIADVKDPTERASLAVDLFGRSGTMLLPMLADGSDGLRKMRDEAHTFSNVMGEDTVAAAEELNDDMDRLKGAMTALWQELAMAVLPTIKSFVEALKSVLTGARDWIKENQTLFNTIATLTLSVGALLSVIGPLTLGIAGAISAFIKIQGTITTLTPVVKGLWTVISGHPFIALAAAAGVAVNALLDWMIKSQDAANANINTGKTIKDLIALHEKEREQINQRIAIYENTLKRMDANSSAAVEYEKRMVEEKQKLALVEKAIVSEKNRLIVESEKTKNAALSEEEKKRQAEIQARELAEAAAAVAIRAQEEAATIKLEEHKAALELSRQEQIAQRVRDTLADKQVVMEEEKAYAIAHAEAMGLSIDEINEYYARKDLERRKAIFAEIINNTKQLVSQVTSLFTQSFKNRSIELENWYRKEKDAINNSQKTEEEKAEAIKELDEKMTLEKKKQAREQARVEKDTALFNAIIDTAAAVAKALPNIPLSIAIGILGAAQVSLIASQPLPALADGAIAFGPTLAMVGDNTRAMTDPEVIAPLSKLEGMMAIRSGNGGSQTIIVELDGRVIARAAAENFPALLRLHGAINT